ncbi:YeiH family protein [Paenibacillus aestuarii]|uniref:YeiH family protein n=1 Tax=Paenibacillus aestuarii TaxID=516965 RepID=A0ABW0KFY8_9BACL|nr:putative sulfate exporter family transporter [Paenibacillus aestuarii]
MSNVVRTNQLPTGVQLPKQSKWASLISKEDWWTVWIGLFVVVFAVVLWAAGGSLKTFSPSFKTWSNWTALWATLGDNALKIIDLYVLLLVLFTVAAVVLKTRVGHFIGGFTALFLLSLIINLFSSWTIASKYGIEAPLVALAIGLIVGNVIQIPVWIDSALRTELYVKVGIILLGATLPFTLIAKAGPVAFLQASIIAVITFLVIFGVAKAFGLDNRFAATLGTGGSVCGVSASIAIGSSIQTKKEHVSVTISLVVIYAVVFIFLLTALIKAFGIEPGPAGAWIGTSEFADAAGITAASSFGDHALNTFTLVKVVGRDMFIGLWCFILAFISITFWEKRSEGPKAGAKQIITRFPKFVLGFFVASILLTIIISNVSAASQTVINSDVIAPIKAIRTWAFTFTFLSIGLTTRFRELTKVGWRPVVAFGAGAIVNVILGYLLSVVIFKSFWSGL